jgi:hypothetical protein
MWRGPMQFLLLRENTNLSVATPIKLKWTPCVAWMCQQKGLWFGAAVVLRTSCVCVRASTAALVREFCNAPPCRRLCMCR